MNQGEQFEGLDLITKLLTKPEKVKRPLIEEINNGKFKSKFKIAFFSIRNFKRVAIMEKKKIQVMNILLIKI